MKYIKLFTIAILIAIISNNVNPSAQSSLRLKIGSFNIENIGHKKLGRPEFVDAVTKVLSRYDIVLIQEIKETDSFEVITKLVAQLNALVKGQSIVYDFSASQGLGLSTNDHREQYAFVYRKTNPNKREIKLSNAYVFDDVDGLFARPPYVATFNILNSALTLKKFTLMNIHARPKFVVEEVTALKKVIDDHKLRFKINDIAVLGDFNFDCDFCSFKKKELVRAEFSDFRWFIRDNYKTTIASTDCAYDRILVTGNKFINAVVPNSNQTFRYDFEYNLSPTQVEDISDHYPVEFDIL